MSVDGIRLTEVLGLKDVCDGKLTIPSIAFGSNNTCTIKVVYSQARVCLTLNKFIHVTGILHENSMSVFSS